jgi:hypothetical protein
MSILLNAIVSVAIAGAGWKGGTATTAAAVRFGDSSRVERMDCRLITDIVVIDGEETPVERKLCRAQGDSGFHSVVFQRGY